MGYQVELMKSVSTTDVKIKVGIYVFCTTITCYVYWIKIDVQFSIKQKIYENLWPKLKPIIPRFFKGIDVKPSLLHGDIWAGNVIQYGSDAGLIFIHYYILLMITTIVIAKWPTVVTLKLFYMYLM